MKCKNGCTFDREEHGHRLSDAMLTAAANFADANAFHICPICLLEELLRTAAFLHLECLKLNAKKSGNPIPADHIYQLFRDAAYMEMYKIVEMEIEGGGIEALQKQ
jgi:hypothetical protein